MVDKLSKILSVTLVVLCGCSGGRGPDTSLGLGADGGYVDASPGSVENAFRVDLDSLPFVHSQDIQNGATNVDNYSCAEGVDESGPELWYALLTDHPVPARFSVTTAADVDVDLYLVQVAGDELTCLAHADSTLAVTLEPGATYLVVDTPVIDGAARPGTYELSITGE